MINNLHVFQQCVGSREHPMCEERMPCVFLLKRFKLITSQQHAASGGGRWPLLGGRPDLIGTAHHRAARPNRAPVCWDAGVPSLSLSLS